MDELVAFEELRWLQTLISAKTRKQQVPQLVEASLLRRGLVERKVGVLELTARGRIALAKLS